MIKPSPAAAAPIWSSPAMLDLAVFSLNIQELGGENFLPNQILIDILTPPIHFTLYWHCIVSSRSLDVVKYEYISIVKSHSPIQHCKESRKIKKNYCSKANSSGGGVVKAIEKKVFSVQTC